MNITQNRSFASILEDLLVETGDPLEGPAVKPAVQFDYLAVAEELHSGAIRVSDKAAVAEYSETASFEPGLAAVLAEQTLAELPPIEPTPLPPNFALGRFDAPRNLAACAAGSRFRTTRIAPRRIYGARHPENAGRQRADRRSSGPART